MNELQTLRKRIIPILYHCQMHKADLTNWWKYQGIVRNQQMFYAYYSALFCRMLYFLETQVVDSAFIQKCNNLLDMYNWYDINESEITKYKESGHNREVWYKSEISELLETYMAELDKSAESQSCIICLYNDKEGNCQARWSAADVRGSVK